MKSLKYFPLLTLLITLPINALIIDKMFFISDAQGNAIITLTNDDDQASFIKATITEIKTDAKGDIYRIPYVKSNIQDWRITITPKFILEPKRTIDIGVRSLCLTNKCAKDKDLMFSIAFEPEPYFNEGEEVTSGVKINYGYAPLYIIPTQNGIINYEIKNLGTTLEVTNKGNTLIRLRIDACSSNIDINCKTILNVIAGRHKIFKLSEKLQVNSLPIEVTNFDSSYKKQLNIIKI